MTQIFFFTNTKLSLIFMIFGYVFFFGGTTQLQQIELIWMAVGSSVLFLILSLYFITKESSKNHDNDKIKQLY